MCDAFSFISIVKVVKGRARFSLAGFQNFLCNPLFLRRDGRFVQRCENVVNPGGGGGGISYEFSFCNLGRKIGKIRRIVGNEERAPLSVSKVSGKSDRVEFSPPRISAGCPENSTEIGENAVEFTRRRILALFSQPATLYFSRLSTPLFSCRKNPPGILLRSDSHVHTHTRAHIHIYTGSHVSFFFTFTFGTDSASKSRHFTFASRHNIFPQIPGEPPSRYKVAFTRSIIDSERGVVFVSLLLLTVTLDSTGVEKLREIMYSEFKSLRASLSLSPFSRVIGAILAYRPREVGS